MMGEYDEIVIGGIEAVRMFANIEGYKSCNAQCLANIAWAFVAADRQLSPQERERERDTKVSIRSKQNLSEPTAFVPSPKS